MRQVYREVKKASASEDFISTSPFQGPGGGPGTMFTQLYAFVKFVKVKILTAIFRLLILSSLISPLSLFPLSSGVGVANRHLKLLAEGKLS